MERFIIELEKERFEVFENFLSTTGLNEYEITSKEQMALDNFKNLNWESFNLESLFGKSTRGRRLKSADRVAGTLPFITAGETDEGVSAFIGNDVKVFSANTTTIDMFGSAKYRNFKYGGDDHIAVVHTDKLPKYASVFVTSAIHKSSYNGQFNYGRNFYAKDADVLDISLPVKDGKPDYGTMETVISAIHKLVIKDVVLYVEKKENRINRTD
ncbi:restriction endonuclease subunit S [Geofilum sp. OHC36d9]|uniref:restriction endonuclease subunit S n=1 Tax=Geofilum sp. OHC36d9 TaxID=3458413 RepID=UPI0040334AA4